MFFFTLCAILITMILALYRGMQGPSLYDRILAVNSFGTKTVLIIAVYGFFDGRPEFLDIAFVYALINFISTVAVLKFFEYGGLGGFEPGAGAAAGGEAGEGEA